MSQLTLLIIRASDRILISRNPNAAWSLRQWTFLPGYPTQIN
jgi:hypothetical protein